MPNLSVFSTPMPRPVDGDVNKEVMFSSRCSHVTPSVSTEFGGKAGLAGWTGLFGFGSAVYLFKNVNIDVKGFFVLHLSDITK